MLESLEAAKQNCVEQKDNCRGLKGELATAALRMNDFMGNLEDRMTDFEGRLARESTVNTRFRHGLEHHLGVTADASKQEGFEIVSLAENTPFVFATPYRVPRTDEERPLCPKESYREPRAHGSCITWPKRFSRRRGPPSTPR